MASTLLVPVTTVTKISDHPNADRLSIAEVLGWQVVTGKGEFAVGDRVVYIPPDALLPVELSDAFGVTQHLSKGRVRQVKLRGEPSFGFVVPFAKAAAQVKELTEGMIGGENYAEALGITKYEPPLRPTAGDAETAHVLFDKFTDVENLRNYPDVILPGEHVVITEKIHGTNSRVGIIEGEIMAGSMEIRRKRPTDEQMASNIYWFPYTLPGVHNLLMAFAGLEKKQVILYGEVYGKVQSLQYDKPNQLGYRAFALKVDGQYLDYPEFSAFMDSYAIPRVPLLHYGAFDKETLKALTSEKSKLAESIMEGVVVQPIHERSDPRIGRVILKYLSEAYLFSKGVTDFKDV